MAHMKLCPLLLAGANKDDLWRLTDESDSSFQELFACRREQCAWWRADDCVAQDIAVNLMLLKDNMKSVLGTIVRHK